jgi:signal transduction histidine kinase
MGAARSLDLLTEIRTVLDGLESELGGRTVDVEMPRLQVQADPEALRRTLTRLVAEAVRRSASGRSITIRTSRWAADLGRGPTSTPHPAALVEVVQENEDCHAEPAVDDLELSAVEADVRAMGGELGWRSEPGRGATFWFTVPLPSGMSGALDV